MFPAPLRNYCSPGDTADLIALLSTESSPFQTSRRHSRLLNSCRPYLTHHIPVVEPPRMRSKELGSIRIEANNKKLSKVTEAPQITISRVDEVFDSLSSSSGFLVFDLSSGFTQFTIYPGTIPLTAFCAGNDAYPKAPPVPPLCSSRWSDLLRPALTISVCTLTQSAQKTAL